MKGSEGRGRGTGGALDRSAVGRVHSVETFGTLDGPGIRYVIFFQGCPLQCKYCQNRDTWDPHMGRVWGREELFTDILRYRGFIESSGGGVTATGGEPLLQAPFVAGLFSSLKNAGIHTALDTSGFGQVTPAVETLLDSTDLILLDLKQIDDEKHRDLTGVSNRLILEFARHASERGIPLWIRHVVVPGYTANRESAARTAEFVAGLEGVKRVELIAYHELGRFKWEALGKRYPLEGVEPPTPELMHELAVVFRNTGLPVVM